MKTPDSRLRADAAPLDSTKGERGPSTRKDLTPPFTLREVEARRPATLNSTRKERGPSAGQDHTTPFTLSEVEARRPATLDSAQGERGPRVQTNRTPPFTLSEVEARRPSLAPVLWLGLALAACTSKPVEVEVPSVPTAPSSTTRWVKPRSATDVGLLEAPARVLPAPHGAAAISPPLKARVLRVRVRPGQRVQEGEALVDVLMPEAVQAAGALSAALIKQEAFAARKVQLEALKAEGLVRASELADVEAQLATARADAQAARATLRAASVSDKAAEGLLSLDGAVALRSPIAGLVSAVEAMPGEVREPTSRPLVEVVGESEGQVEARLPGALVPGARMDFVGPSGAVVALTLLSVSPRVESSDGSRLAWLKAESGTLPVGAAGRVRLQAAPGWTAIPLHAALGEGPERTVFVRQGGGPHAVTVRVVATSGAEVVVDGLALDAEVAADASEVKR